MKPYEKIGIVLMLWAVLYTAAGYYDRPIEGAIIIVVMLIGQMVFLFSSKPRD